jgi:hypothetical protein
MFHLVTMNVVRLSSPMFGNKRFEMTQTGVENSPGARYQKVAMGVNRTGAVETTIPGVEVPNHYAELRVRGQAKIPL